MLLPTVLIFIVGLITLIFGFVSGEKEAILMGVLFPNGCPFFYWLSYFIPGRLRFNEYVSSCYL